MNRLTYFFFIKQGEVIRSVNDINAEVIMIQVAFSPFFKKKIKVVVSHDNFNVVSKKLKSSRFMMTFFNILKPS